jgi:hypothetical protein
MQSEGIKNNPAHPHNILPDIPSVKSVTHPQETVFCAEGNSS